MKIVKNGLCFKINLISTSVELESDNVCLSENFGAAYRAQKMVGFS